MTPTERLIAQNLAYLEQGIDLVQRLDDAVYRTPLPPPTGSGIGTHLRHILDHYTCFLNGLEAGRIDFDHRARDIRLETNRAFAEAAARTIMQDLETLGGEDRAVDVKMDCDPHAEAETVWTRSTIRRELQYLVAHTIHHYALIAVMLQLHGQEPGPGFGVAPSTLRHRRDASTAHPAG